MTTIMASSQYYQELVSFTAQATYRFLLAGEDGEVSEESRVPVTLRNWLGRLRLLYGLPFAYLVPDEKLLPKESIRFFYIDRNWTDRLVDGALSVGKTTTRDYAHHHAVNAQVRQGADDEERYVRQYFRDQEPERTTAEGGDLTGMLMRSRVVSGWPGLEVRAYKDGDEEADKLTLLRMDRLAPDVMLCIFNDIPTIVDVEEPREGILFGVDDAQGLHVPSPSGFALKLRHIYGTHAGWSVGHPEIDDGKEEVAVAVPVRKAHRRVVHVQKLAETLASQLDANGIPYDPPGTPVSQKEFSSADLAVEMYQPPYRQRFTGTEVPDEEEYAGWTIESTYAAATFKVGQVMAPLSEAEINKLFPQGGGG